jgi:hypothetical protein
MTAGNITQAERSWWQRFLSFLVARAQPGSDEFRRQLRHALIDAGAWALVLIPVGQFAVFAAQRILWLSIPAALTVLAGVIALRVSSFALREGL